VTSSGNEVVPGRETLVRRRGVSWSFHLPHQHRIELSEDRSYANLSTPETSTTFAVERIDESYPEEVVVMLGDAQVAEANGYPLPEIRDEFDRLRARWRAAGLDEEEFNSWAQGSTNENQLQRLRKKLRDVGG
jgi:hypothetical protein